MKKFLALLLAVVLILGLVACGTDTTKKEDGSKSATETKEPEKTDSAKEEEKEPDSTSTPEETTGETVVAKLVFVGPLTGEQAQYGIAVKQACELAISRWNEKKIQVDGKTVEFILDSYDDAGKVDEAAAVAEQIASDDSVIAIPNAHFGSAVALVACQTYQNAGILAISNASSHPDYTKIGEYCCRDNVTDFTESQNGIQMLVRMGYKKIALAGAEDDFGVSAIEYGKQNIQTLQDEGIDVECVGSEFFAAVTDDYTAVLSKLNATGCDVVMNYGTYTQIAPFAIQKQKAGYEWDIMAVGNAQDDNLLSAGGDAVEGICLPASFNVDSEDPVMQQFIADFKEYSGGTLPNCYTTNAWDSCNYICYLVEQTGSLDRKTLMEAAHEIPYDGVTGTVMFDENNECPKIQYVMKIENGKFVEIPHFLTLWDEFVAEMKDGAGA